MQVLIVDDDMATVDVIKNSVKWKELGVSDIFTAYNIQLAKEILKEHNIDIVISDICMPEADGLLFSEECVKLFPEIKIPGPATDHKELFHL